MLYTVSTYSFESHSPTTEIRVLDIENGNSILVLTNDPNASEPKWLGLGDQITWLLSGNKGTTKLMIGGRIGPGFPWLKYAMDTARVLVEKLMKSSQSVPCSYLPRTPFESQSQDNHRRYRCRCIYGPSNAKWRAV